MNRITFAKGLVISEIITRLLIENETLDEELEKNDTHVVIYALQNCREQGYQYSVYSRKTLKTFTWCTYEHRNSDQIIINGKEGIHTMSGDIPYKGDKFNFIESFEYNQFYEAAEALSKMIIKFINEEEVEKTK